MRQVPRPFADMPTGNPAGIFAVSAVLQERIELSTSAQELMRSRPRCFSTWVLCRRR